ncbi:MAG: sigma-70 family RNA polymerase sigma factor [Planctomycetota bacterium]
MTDTDALHAYIQRRDPDAFAYLVQTYQGLVYSACRRQLNDPADIEDAVQATFIKLAEKAQTIRTSVGSWLYRCALNASTDIGRSTTRRRKRESVYAEQREVSDDPQARHELQLHIDEALMAVSEEHRQLVVEHFFQGRTQTELAREAGVSVTVMNRRVAAAVDAVRGRLKTPAVAMPAAIVTGFLAEQGAAAAVPSVLTTSLVKLGVAGVGPAATTATTSLSLSQIGAFLVTTAKTKPLLSSLIVLGMMLAGSGVVLTLNQPTGAAPPSTSPPPVGTPPTTSPPKLSIGVVISRTAVDAEIGIFAGEYAKDSETAEDVEKRFAFAWHSRVADHVRDEVEVPYELIAVIDPGTAEDKLIQRRMNTLGITSSILGTDADAIAELDVVLMTSTAELGEGQVQALLEAVRGGTGLLAIGWMPDGGTELLTEGETGYVVTFGAHPAELVIDHDIFPGFDVGDSFVVNPNGTVVNPSDVTPLLQLSAEETQRLEEGQRFDLHDFPDGFRFTPLFVNEIGQGRVMYSATAGHMMGGRMPTPIMEATDGGIIADGIAWLAEGKKLAEAAAASE